MEFRQIKPGINSLVLFIIVSLFFLLSACGGGESSSIDSTSGTGSISFNLDWENTSAQRAVRQSPSGDVCADYAIDSIDVTVENSSNAIITSESWPCSAHQGAIADVPAGSGITLSIGGIVAGNTDWRNQITGISVLEGQNTDIGTIVMNYYGSDTTPPTVSAHYPAAGSTGVFLDTTITAVFSENVVAASVNPSSCTVVKASTTDQVACAVSYDTSTRTASVTPSVQLDPNLDYTVTITMDIEDLAGLNMTTEESWTFTTGTSTEQTLIWNSSNWDEAVWN